MAVCGILAAVCGMIRLLLISGGEGENAPDTSVARLVVFAGVCGVVLRSLLYLRNPAQNGFGRLLDRSLLSIRRFGVETANKRQRIDPQPFCRLG